MRVGNDSDIHRKVLISIIGFSDQVQKDYDQNNRNSVQFGLFMNAQAFRGPYK